MSSSSPSVFIANAVEVVGAVENPVGLLGEAGVRDLFESRQPAYRQAAHFAVNGEATPDVVVEETLTRLEEDGWHLPG